LIHVHCRNCGTFELVGPGHPAGLTDPETGAFTLTDRSALRHASAEGHEDGCQPDPETGHYPLALTFIAPAGAVPAGGQ
jgi:hypothetical protein